VNNESVKENTLTTDAQLNATKVTITTGDLDPAMVLTGVHLRVAQEIPKLPTGEYSGGRGQGKEPSQGIKKALPGHGQY